MKSNYKELGGYIQQVNARNADGSVNMLRGINIQKKFMPSVANMTGVDLTKYKTVLRGQFAYNPMHVGRDRVLPISLQEDEDCIIVSPAYVVFEIIDEQELHRDYLMMWFNRPEFDRMAWFTTDNSVRGGFSWDVLCRMKLPVVDPSKQRRVVDEYNGVVDRIRLNNQINDELLKVADLLKSSCFDGTSVD